MRRKNPDTIKTIERLLWRLKREHIIKSHAACEILSLALPDAPCLTAFKKQFYRWTDYKLDKESQKWIAGCTTVLPRQNIKEAIDEWLLLPREDD